MSTRRTIAAALITRLQLINGSGGYTLDLTGDDQIRQTIEIEAIRKDVPVVHFDIGNFSSSNAGQMALGYRSRRLLVTVWGFVPSDLADGTDTALEGSDLEDDLMRAIESDVTLGSNVHDVIIDSATVDGNEVHYSLGGTSVVVMQITMVWTEQRRGVT